MVIAIDFDGTCTTHAYPDIGCDIGAEPVLRRLVDEGHQLILWTMRSGSELEAAVGWFQQRHIPLYGINLNPTQRHWTKSRKPHAQLYIDDAALGCPLCKPKFPGGNCYVDWKKVEQMLFLAPEGLKEVSALSASGPWLLPRLEPRRKLWGKILMALGGPPQGFVRKGATRHDRQFGTHLFD